MTLNDLIQQQVQLLANRIGEKDPHAKIELRNAAIEVIANSHESPVADLFVTTGGKVYQYCLVHDQFTGKFRTVPFINQ